MSASLLLRNVRVVDGRGVRAERADVLLADGRIQRINSGGGSAADGATDLGTFQVQVEKRPAVATNRSTSRPRRPKDGATVSGRRVGP